MSAPTAAVASSGERLELRALAGDRDAERELCRRLLPALRAFARRRLRPASAEDFAQDALLLFLEALREGRIEDPAQVAGFALGICRNLARAGARTDERRHDLFARFGVREAELEVWQAPLAVRRDHLEDCYSQLPDRTRRVLRQSFCADDVDADIASALELTEANVRVIRHRALAALRECLGKPISWVQS